MVDSLVVSRFLNKQVFLRYENFNGVIKSIYGIVIAYNDQELNLQFIDGSDTILPVHLSSIRMIRPDEKKPGHAADKEQEDDDGR